MEIVGIQFVFARVVASTPSAPSLSTTGWDFYGITIGEWAQLFSLPLSLMVAYFTLRHATKLQRGAQREANQMQLILLIKNELCCCINSLIDDCDQAANYVEKNLTKKGEISLNAEKAEHLRKSAETQIEIIKVYLDQPTKIELENLYNRWYDLVFANPWPLGGRGPALLLHSARIQDIGKARDDWNTYLTTLKVKYITEICGLSHREE